MEHAMMERRYFAIEPMWYEQTRLSLGEALELRPDQTIYDPADIAPHDANGRVLLAAWSRDCEVPPIAAAIAEMLDTESGRELTEAEYQAALPVSPAFP